MDSLATYKTHDGKDAESIVERVMPRLQHANCAVVLSAVKVVCCSSNTTMTTGLFEAKSALLHMVPARVHTAVLQVLQK